MWTHTNTHIMQYLNITACLLIGTKQSFALHPHSTLGIVIGHLTPTLMSASITFNVMEPVYFCLQGSNNPGSRMSTYVDVSNHQNPAGSTRPSNRKVKQSPLQTSSCPASVVCGIWYNALQLHSGAPCGNHLHKIESCFKSCSP